LIEANKRNSNNETFAKVLTEIETEQLSSATVIVFMIAVVLMLVGLVIGINVMISQKNRMLYMRHSR
jgi:hypothetical protein